MTFATVEVGLPRPEVNLPVFDREGRLLGIPDLLWPDAALVLEYDGSGHRDRRQHRDDNVREELLECAGLTVVRVQTRCKPLPSAPNCGKRRSDTPTGRLMFHRKWPRRAGGVGQLGDHWVRAMVVAGRDGMAVMAWSSARISEVPRRSRLTTSGASSMAWRSARLSTSAAARV